MAMQNEKLYVTGANIIHFPNLQYMKIRNIIMNYCHVKLAILKCSIVISQALGCGGVQVWAMELQPCFCANIRHQIALLLES